MEEKGFGGVTESERRAAIHWVDDYLLLCEQRRLDEASQYLAPNALLTFAGNFKYTRLVDMVADAARRYKWVKKSRKFFDVFTDTDGNIVVVSRGSLRGESLSGRLFSGIRYQDRFVFHDGKIVDQQVWNDLGASGVLDPLAHLYELHQADRVEPEGQDRSPARD